MALLQLPQATHSHETLLEVTKLALALGIPLLFRVKQVSIIHWKPEHFVWLSTYLEQGGCVPAAGSGGSGDLQPLFSSLTHHEQPCPEGLEGLWALRGSMKGCVSDLVSLVGDVLKSGTARVRPTTN